MKLLLLGTMLILTGCSFDGVITPQQYAVAEKACAAYQGVYVVQAHANADEAWVRVTCHDGSSHTVKK